MIEIRDIPAGGRVTEPGLYRMTAETYHADPCPVPSLSSGAIRRLLSCSPLHAYTDHPRLGNARADVSSQVQTLGTVAHKLILGAGRDLEVIDADDYRSKAAREARDAATAEGKTPVLRERYEGAVKIATIAGRNIRNLPGGRDALAFGLPELVCVWQEGGIWCRSMMDLAPFDPDADGWWTIHDLKTSALAFDINTLSRYLVSSGYDIQAAHYTRGFETVVPAAAGRTRFRFWFAESDAPYCVVPVQCGGLMLATAEQKVMAAIAIWAHCLSTGEFPGYPTDLMRCDPPNFLENQWREREQSDALIADALNNNWSKAA